MKVAPALSALGDYERTAEDDGSGCKRAPATNRFNNPGLIDGLIAAEQILRAARGADEERPSRRNPHGTCATGSRPQGVRAHAQTPFCDLGNRRSVQRLVTGRSAAISVAARLHFGCPQPLALTPSC